MKQKRGSVKRSQSVMVAVWLPTNMALTLDRAVESQDTDRSKFIRNAVRRQLEAAK